MKTIAITVRGRVQGVFFRQSTKEKADELGITGSVMNAHNGDVRIIASGDEKKLSQLVEWCRHGPPRARVDTIEVNGVPFEQFSDFRVIR
ncbi:MAG TPA: acylphosphatase [Chitinophagaceae bacterium]|nr:acylphosphatase [Chitinophagaceae bacterium]